MSLFQARMIVIFGLLCFVIASQAWEQASQGAHATPSLLGKLAQLAIGVLFGLEGLVKIAETFSNRTKEKEKDSRDKKS